MKIGIGNDHVGVDYKNEISRYISEQYGYEVINFGTDQKVRVDYPDIAAKLAYSLNNKEIDKGILICGSGVGMGIAANKIKGIRCVICSEPYSAKMSRLHNDANVLAFGSRVIGLEMAKLIVDTWLTTIYEGGRHQIRLDKISNLENQ